MSGIIGWTNSRSGIVTPQSAWQKAGGKQTTFSTTDWHITGFNDSFKIWMIQIDSMRPDGDAKEGKIYFLKDATTDATGTLEYASMNRDSGGVNDNQSNTNFPYVCPAMGNNVERMSNGSIVVYNARNTSSVVNASMQFNIIQNNGEVRTEVGSMTMNGADSEKIVGVRIVPWSGNWSSVSAQVYGLN